MPEFNLYFSPTSSTEDSSFKLLELTKDLCELVECSTNQPVHFSVRGQKGEDAVFCTDNETYSMKSVSLSNSILVVTSHPHHSDNDVVICDQAREIIELSPSFPKFHALASLLCGKGYDDEQDEDMPEAGLVRKSLTYKGALELIPASDAEIDQGLKDRRILVLEGILRHIDRNYLGRLLELILNILITLSLPPEAVPLEQLVSVLADEHNIHRTVSTQVMSWFGAVSGGNWIVNLKMLIKEVGLGLLRPHVHDPIRTGKLLLDWKSVVGDTYEKHVDLDLLTGNFLVSQNDKEALLYFPSSSLPIDAAARFTDLFHARTRWKAQDISAFLSDLSVDSKEIDKLLLKFARATTNAEGVWYTSRVQL